VQLEIFYGNGEAVDAAKAGLARREGILLNYRKIWTILDDVYRYMRGCLFVLVGYVSVCLDILVRDPKVVEV
jgi:hypothetical protein